MKLYIRCSRPGERESHARQHEMAYVMLDRALRQTDSACHIDGDYTIDRTEKGKPYLSSHPYIHFNLSHCAEAVAVALSDHPVGIDVQGSFPWKENLARRICSEAEWAVLEALEDTEQKRQMLHRLWCRKEAVLKCVGTGIAADLREADCLPRDGVLIYDGGTFRFAEYEDQTMKLCVCEKI